MSKTELIIGVAGGSASGKTTFASKLQQALGEAACEILYQDSYYLDRSEQFDHDGGAVNFDHPNALEFDLLVQHLEELRQGLTVQVPIYDFATHKRKKQTTAFPAKSIVLIDGILILSQPKVRECLDLSVFIETSEPVRFERRLERDVKERGRTPDGVRSQFEAHVKPMHDQFVEPSQRHADYVYSGEHEVAGCVSEFLKELQDDYALHIKNPASPQYE